MPEVGFRSWSRSAMYGLATGVAVDGRLRGSVVLRADDVHNGGPGRQRTLGFDIVGPRDVRGLQRGAIVSVTPREDATAVETTFCATAELSQPDLPWRYSPVLANNETLRPWLVLVVGTPDEIEVVGDEQVRLSTALTADYPLSESPMWAHVQEWPDGRRRGRLVSPRILEPSKPQIAAIVPAFDALARPSWGPGSSEPGSPVTLRAYRHWRFTTGPAGDFLTLCRRLGGHDPSAAGGAVAVRYGRLPGDPEFEVPGALMAATVGPASPIPAAVLADAQTLTERPADPTGREAVAPPRYGEPWIEQVLDTEWGAELNHNPAWRVVAGLGVAAAFHFERELVQAMREQAGDFRIADQRVRELSLGVLASGKLWEAYLPASTGGRLALLGPSMGRLAVEHEGEVGPFSELVTGDSRPLAAAMFSASAQRTLRESAPWMRLSSDTSLEKLIVASSVCPQPSGRLAQAEVLLKLSGIDPDSILVRGAAPRDPIDALRALAQLHAPRTPAIESLIDTIEGTFADGVGDMLAVTTLHRLLTSGLTEIQIAERAGAVQVNVDRQDPRSPIPSDAGRPPLPWPCAALDPEQVTAVLVDALDPTGPDAPAPTRVLGTLDGISETSPPELRPYLPINLWTFVRDHFPSLLLPGHSDFPEDTVALLRPNPAFVEAFLVGANTRLLEAMRRYDYRVAAPATPLKCFWGRYDEDGNLAHDIGDLDQLDVAAGVGDHVTTSAGRAALAFRSELFLRYPDARVSMLPAAPDEDGEPDFSEFSDSDLERPREWPTFQGAVGNLVFFGFDLEPGSIGGYWIVIEEGERDLQFRAVPFDEDAVPPPTNDGANWALRHLTGPVRAVFPSSRLVEVP